MFRFTYKKTSSVRPKLKAWSASESERRIAGRANFESALLDERFKMVVEDYQRRGTPQPMIETFPDLSQEEKAELYDRAVLWKRSPLHQKPLR